MCPLTLQFRIHGQQGAHIGLRTFLKIAKSVPGRTFVVSLDVGSQEIEGFQNLELQHSCVRWLSSYLFMISMKDSFMVKTLRYKIREILTKNQKEKSREIFRAIY